MGCEKKSKEAKVAADQDHGQNRDLALREDTTTTDGVDLEHTAQDREVVLEVTVTVREGITIMVRRTSNPNIVGMI